MSKRVAVVGPTAAGKSDLALELGEHLGGPKGVEIINADASQLYQGMDIGTAKLSVQQRRGFPHHQLDVLTVREAASVAAYQRHARTDLHGIAERGRRAIIVGGSGLYVRAITDALDFPGTDSAVRASLEERAQREGTRALWEELATTDPASAKRIEPANTRKIVRALEVVQVTGRPFSATLPAYTDAVPTIHLALRPPRAALNTRINTRAQAMFDGGLLEETAALVDLGLREGPTASRAIGYAQALAVLVGAMSLPEAVEATAAATRKLASRQIKWFRRDPRLHWIDVDLKDDGTMPTGEWERVTEVALSLVQAADPVA
ncbi:tRNA (adenosine(37)-N6)-dimethylallyltransferase MiaA [Actinomyces bovis]|uniref:tRNA (adenosine(37)-N6)-dimethylallyltransferase MiaA n=1 Tax=Actinomyces bovis TaxID=1658 RepID=UPI000DD0E6D9|nr:tRNA (adenosine(37)-N6)-dimethylallyltransferase MiaA [Actinomyces bovis]